MVALRPASPAAYHGHISAPAALGGIGRTGQSGGLVGGAAGGSDSGSTGDAASELLSKERATSLKLSTAAFPAASLYAASHATRSSNSKNGSSASSGANSQASSAANTPGRPLPPQTAGSAASFNQRRPSFVQPLPPHVFDLVASAFVHMINDKQDQCVILSGESNCGKSESGRLIARHLCDLTKLSASAKKTRIHSGAMKLDFVLSAFGNAVTPENTNASRFSRYTEYQFDENGFMAGVKILAYNLEKSRVTEASDAHANFDVFYYLLAGIDAGMRAKWSLAEPSHFAYLNRVQSKPAVLLTHHHFDPDNLEKLRHHLSAVGIAKQTHDDMFRLLAAILNLGNIAFARTAELSANEPCTIKNLPQLETTAELLGLRAEHLMAALTYETKAVGRELCTVILDLDGAARQRDRLAQLLYSLLFQWIVEATNARMCKEEADWANYISVVDFASVQASSPGSASSSASPHGPAAANGRGLLSRLVTNYASERLHGFVLDQMALSVDRLVAARAVPEHSKTAAAAIESNQTVLRLLGAPSTGIIAILQKDVSRRERFGAGIGLVGSIKGSGSGGANGTAPARASRVLRASRVGSMFFGAGHSITGGSGANAAQGSSATASLPSTAAQQAVLDRISRICGDNPKLSLVASISTTATRQQYNTAFGIHHYSGMVHYDMSMLDASTSDASTSISTDFVSLFCGSMDQPATASPLSANCSPSAPLPSTCIQRTGRRSCALDRVCCQHVGHPRCDGAKQSVQATPVLRIRVHRRAI
ncbi:myosin head-domain-containing protein [Entophlyctis helioformis]|nr:myosin head-domain-containing protein [Entophlyctis helioformis]